MHGVENDRAGVVLNRSTCHRQLFDGSFRQPSHGVIERLPHRSHRRERRVDKAYTHSSNRSIAGGSKPRCDPLQPRPNKSTVEYFLDGAPSHRYHSRATRRTMCSLTGRPRRGCGSIEHHSVSTVTPFSLLDAFRITIPRDPI